MANAILPSLPSSVPAPRHAIDRAAAKIEPHLRALFDRLPAGVSLSTGGVLILATVFLPLAVNGCGGYAGTGRDIIAGEADTYWPSLLGMSDFGRWFYIFLLAWAALAIVVVLAHLCRRDLSRPHVPLLTCVAGSISYFVMVDFMIWPIIFLGDGLPGKVQGGLALFSLALAAYLFLRTARVESVRISRPLRLVFLIGGGMQALLLVVSLRMGESIFDPIDSTAGDVALGVLRFSPLVLSLAAPLGLWFRHGVWQMVDSARYWPSLRRRLALAYAPAVAGQFYAAYKSFVEPSVWGLALCLAGIHLVTLGYLGLRKQVDAAQTAHSGSLPTAAQTMVLQGRESIP